MFEHPDFVVHGLNEIPLGVECYLMDEVYLGVYEKFMLEVMSGGAYDHPPGYISHAVVREMGDTALQLSWYPNIYDRFHEVRVALPKSEILTCVESWRWSERPHIFVKSTWLNDLHLRSYSVFGFIDAIGVKKAIQDGTLRRDLLVTLRGKIDELGKSYPQASFISFADSVLVKSNWSVGMVGSDVRYSYQPEVFLTIVKEFQHIFKESLGFAVYAVLTQGQNEYYDDSLLHISASQDHICLNSLGLPFAQLRAIDEAARANIRNEVHPPSELYMDKHFFRSLRLKFEFRKVEDDRLNEYVYHDKMSGSDAFYYAAQLGEILDNVAPEISKIGRAHV
jgi:hypothetical protein